MTSLSFALLVGCSSSGGASHPASVASQGAGDDSGGKKLDLPGQDACSYFNLAKVKAEASGGDAGEHEIQQGLSVAQQSTTSGFAGDLASGITDNGGGNFEDKAKELLDVCSRYGG